MAEKIGARKDSSFKAVCTAPDFCRTPVGPSTPPLPYMIISDLSESVQTVLSVRFNGKPCLVLDQSIVPTCTGDEPGTAKGIRSGTVGGKTKPTSASSTVRAGGKNIVRERDTCTMNDGNTNGLFLIQPQPGCGIGADCKPTEETNPGVLKPKPKEQSFLDKVKDQLSEAVNKPNEAFKGAIKGILNIPSELGELLLKSAAYDSALKTEESAAMLALFGDSKSAAQLSEAAAQQRAGTDAINVPKIKMNNPAQEGGDLVATVAQLIIGGAGIIKGGFKAGVKTVGKSGKTAVKKGAALAKEEKALAGAANEGDGVKILQGETEKSVIDKLEKYLLNSEHNQGKNKAKWFDQALGYNRDNIDGLAKQIVFDPAKSVQTGVTEFGTKYNQVISITGANGKKIDVTFAWIKNNDGVVRLVTAIPTK